MPFPTFRTSPRPKEKKQNEVAMKRFLYFSFAITILPLALFYLLRILLIKTGLIFQTKRLWRWIEDGVHVYQSYRVPEFNGATLQENLLYRKVSTYLNSLPSLLEDSDSTNLVVPSSAKPTEIALRLDHGGRQVVCDDFLGARIVWECSPGVFVLRIRKKDRRRLLRPYLQHIHAVSDEVEEIKGRELKLHVNGAGDGTGGRWRAVPFVNPSTFETVTMEADLKCKIKSDLESFLKGKQYYHRLGRAWKRSYLLYGPSGTGKSAFVAAMANFLRYDVYEVDLTRVADDADLKLLLLETRSRAVILIEDLDRFISDREMRSPAGTGVTLAGVLSFMDGILSCCAEERVMVFTMNSKDHVDPTLLRPGRIDVHIHFPLCDFLAFKTMASSYLGVKDHKLFPQVEEIFLAGAALTPAEIGELMIANRSSPSRALKSVINALQTEGESRSGRRKPLPPVHDPDDHSGIFSRDGVNAMGKDIKKLYGLLRLRSSRRIESLDLSPRPQ